MLLKNYISLKWLWRPILLYCEKYIKNINYNNFDYINYLFYIYYYDIRDKFIRQQNIKYLDDFLQIKTSINNIGYFTYPLLFESSKKRNTIRQILIKYNIYCPIYWPLYFDNKNKCNHYIENHILCIPIDQRYNINNMKFITNIINHNL